MTKTTTGFTLVELIVIIVIIGILASIGIVSYNGVQARSRDSKRQDDVAKIGQGLKLWAGTDKSLATFGGGNGGQAFGWFESTYGANSSIKQILVNSGYATSGMRDPRFVTSTQDYIISLCTNAADNRRIIMAKLEIPPSQTVAQQLAQSTCTTGQWQGWVTANGMNYAVVF